MVYQGSKNTLAKELLPLILKGRKPDQYYVEPFAGGMNLINKVSGNRIANDINIYLIELFKAVIEDDWEPPLNITYEEYTDIRLNKELYPEELVGYVGFIWSFSGKFFGGYLGQMSRETTGKVRILELYKNFMKNLLPLYGVEFSCKDYREMEIPDDSIIYCDPPYADTSEYKGVEDFNISEFWDWVRKKRKEGFKIYVSERDAPADFTCIFEKVRYSQLGGTLKKVDERLFI